MGHSSLVYGLWILLKIIKSSIYQTPSWMAVAGNFCPKTEQHDNFIYTPPANQLASMSILTNIYSTLVVIMCCPLEVSNYILVLWHHGDTINELIHNLIKQKCWVPLDAIKQLNSLVPYIMTGLCLCLYVLLSQFWGEGLFRAVE